MLAKERILERTESGEFEQIVSGNAIDPPFVDHKGQLCVRTEEILIVDHTYPAGHHRHEVARLHRFVTEDGTTGASGLPDPKELMIGDLNYRMLKHKNPRCELCEGG